MLAGCSGNAHIDVANSQAADPATVDFPIFYVKRTIPPHYGRSAHAARCGPARPMTSSWSRRPICSCAQSASPSADEINITTRVTGTDTYDVKDVDVSLDGKAVVFAMRGPLTEKMKQKDPPTWHLWEYVIATDTLRQVIPPWLVPDQSNNVAPHYMPDGRIVFSSTAQRQSKAVLLDEGKPQFEAQDEDRNEPAFDLHVISADRTEFHQVSFNQSHDRDATVLANGRILFTRWDHVPGKDAMHMYTSNPDGTDEQLYYGANSHLTGTNPAGTNDAVIEFVKPKEMQDGRILTLARPYTNIDFGGDLLIINGNQFVENTQPLLADAGMPGPAQTRATANNVLDVPGPSPGGRFNSAFPAVGRLDPDPGQLVAVPPARYRWRDDCSLHRCAPAGPDGQGRTAPLQRLDVQSFAEHAAADHAADGRRHGHRRGGRAAACASEHHPGQGPRGGLRPDAGQ